MRATLGRLQALDPAIRLLVPGARLCGPARTVQTHLGGLLPVIRAAERASPGEVLVVEAGGSPRGTCWGGSLSLYAVARGLAGLVANASVRDLAEIRALEFPVFAPGASVRGALYDAGGGAYDLPVALGDVVVAPGDLVLGDDDGVVVVPRPEAERVLEATRAQFEKEQRWERELRAGRPLSELLGLPPAP